MPGRCQTVFHAHGGADFIEGVLATGLPVFCCEAVGELRTVVSQQFDDPDRRGQLAPAQRSTLLLSVSSARDGVKGRGQTGHARTRRWIRQHEIVHQVLGRTPMSNTVHRFFIFQELWIRRA